MVGGVGFVLVYSILVVIVEGEWAVFGGLQRFIVTNEKFDG